MPQSTLSRHPAVDDSAIITNEPIDITALLAEAHHPSAGGVVLFSGEVRNINEGKGVLFLEYEAYGSMAATMIRDIVSEAVQKWNLRYARAIHRIGRLELTESAVVVITAHAHRREAYDANQYIIDRVKAEAPVWKCEHYVDGTHEWVHHC